MKSGSVSKIKVVLEIQNKTKIFCELKRHLSPKIVGMISRSLPLRGNVHLLGKMAYFETRLNCGIERPTKEYNKGDIAFLPVNGTICFFTDKTTTNSAMSPIGKITSNVDALNTAKPGDVFVLYAETV